MRTSELCMAVCVFLATFLVGGISLADDSGVFDSVGSNSTLEAPNLAVKIEGTVVTLSWIKMSGAAYYLVAYAQYPYDNPDTINTIDVGDKTSAVYELWPGCAYQVAVKACDAGFDCSDYSNTHDIMIPLVSTYKNSIGQEFKLIPAGTFTMGSPLDEPGRTSDEKQHQVTLTQPFYMQTTEVTQAQWKAVMGNNHSSSSGCPTCPVENATWDDAQAFITEMNLRGEGTYSLPTEAQWEYAARAGSTTAFYNGHITQALGDDPKLDAIGWYNQNSDSKSHPVKLKSPNAWGLHDMSGNVSEWCQDWYDSYPLGEVIDPIGPPNNRVPCFKAPCYDGHVVRGGSWGHYASGCRSAWRYPGPPKDWGWFTVGFRLTREQ